MRKYHQLALLIICGFSIAVLLIYKSENNRLKYVLKVVNYFGRKDASIIMRSENGTNDEVYLNFGYPMPIWWSLGPDFHIYAAYWNQNELVVGGEVIAIVIGNAKAIVNHKCTLIFANKTAQGKFKFQRVVYDTFKSEEMYMTYRFYCKLSSNIGVPNSVKFMDNRSKAEQEIKLRHLKPNNRSQNKFKEEPMTVCVDSVNYNMSSKFSSNKNILQFFLYHQAIGIEYFIVYNSDSISWNLRQLLRKNNLKIEFFPFNFPFILKNSSEYVRNIIETDCIMRNKYNARYTTLLKLNEFFYPSTKIKDPNSILRSLDQYSIDISHFEIPSFAVCFDSKIKTLVDNHLYDPEVQLPNKIYIYRTLSNSIYTTEEDKIKSKHSMTISLSKGLSHRYIDCNHIGNDGLFDWRTTVRKDFMEHLNVLRTEIDNLL